MYSKFSYESQGRNRRKAYSINGFEKFCTLKIIIQSGGFQKTSQTKKMIKKTNDKPGTCKKPTNNTFSEEKNG